jgi:hypothetical protein
MERRKKRGVRVEERERKCFFVRAALSRTAATASAIRQQKNRQKRPSCSLGA